MKRNKAGERENRNTTNDTRGLERRDCHLRKRGKEGEIARFRLENERREIMEEEKRKCKMCEAEKET